MVGLGPKSFQRSDEGGPPGPPFLLADTATGLLGQVPWTAYFHRLGVACRMSLEQAIVRLIEPSIEDMGFELVRVRLSGTQRVVLQIMADRADGRPISVDDCADISRAVSAILDVDDPITTAYSLEVSSPGIDRPLTRLKDFAAYIGHDAKIELERLVDGRRRFRGTLHSVDGDIVTLETDQGPAAIAFTDIRNAKLVMTDALLEAALEAAREAGLEEDGVAEGAAL